jgi:hypothetical protein
MISGEGAEMQSLERGTRKRRTLEQYEQEMLTAKQAQALLRVLSYVNESEHLQGMEKVAYRQAVKKIGKAWSNRQ